MFNLIHVHLLGVEQLQFINILPGIYYQDSKTASRNGHIPRFIHSIELKSSQTACLLLTAI